MRKMTLIAAAALLASTAMVGSALAQSEPPAQMPSGGCMMMEGGPMMDGPGKEGPRGKQGRHGKHSNHGHAMHGHGMYGQMSLDTPVTPARVKSVVEGQIARWGQPLTVGNVTEQGKVITAEILDANGKLVRNLSVSTENGRFFQVMTPERLRDIITGRIAMHGGNWKVGEVKQDGSKVIAEVLDSDGKVNHTVTFDNATGGFERSLNKKK